MLRLLFVLISYFESVLLPKWRQHKTADATHFYRRTLTRTYKKKRSTVKSIWIGAGTLMLAFPLPQFIIPAMLFTSFISFCILDEALL